MCRSPARPSFGLINSLRTGNIIFDMIIALIVPMVFRMLFDDNNVVIRWLRAAVQRSHSSGEAVRIITSTRSRNCGLVGECKNGLLQKALTLYFNDQKIPFDRKAQVSLTSIHEARNRFELDDKFNPLDKYRLTWLAPDNEWVELGAYGIQFRQYQHCSGGGEDGSKSTSDRKEMLMFELKCSASNGHERIDTLLSDAVSWYQAELRKLKDDKRYMYVMQQADAWSMKSTDKLEDLSMLYKRYLLTDSKTFGSLFFPHKQALLDLLGDFMHKRGKYDVPGYPRKLGLLLHGPPGTGKTSLIKALAQYTGRSIINIPLAQIKTNQQLMDVMYDLKMKVEGIDDTKTLQFKDVLFVIEDVDAASKIVLRRDGGGGAGSGADGGVGASGGGAGIDAPAAATLAEMQTLVRESLHGKSVSGGAQLVEGPKAPGGGSDSMLDAVESLIKPKQDALNLAGLLNVLDGVVDTPERILILTSNHPEMLDPALIRPGRVDRQIYLGYLQPAAAVQMVEHYFGEKVGAAQKAKLAEVLAPLSDGRSPTFTPATMEMLCAQQSTIDGLIVALETHLRPTAGGKAAEVQAPFDAMAISRQKSGG